MKELGRATRRSLLLMRATIRAVKEAMPDTDPALIGGFFADLLDLWETGQRLDEELRKLAGMRFPRDLGRLGDILCWISAIQIDMASYWIEEVKKDLPKLRRALDKLGDPPPSGKKGRMPAIKLSSGKRKSASRRVPHP